MNVVNHQFSVILAKEYGIVEAILINNFQYWIAKNMANRINFYDGRYWTYNSRPAFQELFPYLTYDQIRRALERLIAKGVLLKGNYNEIPTDRTLWYSFTDEFETFWQKSVMEMAKMPNPSGKIAQPIPNSKTTDNIPPNDSTLFDISHKDSIIIPQGSVEKSVKRFVKPTIEQIKAYCEERKNGIDAEDFYYFYESKGWKIGSSPMKDWKAAIRTWEIKKKQMEAPKPKNNVFVP